MYWSLCISLYVLVFMYWSLCIGLYVLVFITLPSLYSAVAMWWIVRRAKLVGIHHLPIIHPLFSAFTTLITPPHHSPLFCVVP